MYKRYKRLTTTVELDIHLSKSITRMIILNTNTNINTVLKWISERCHDNLFPGGHPPYSLREISNKLCIQGQPSAKSSSASSSHSSPWEGGLQTQGLHGGCQSWHTLFFFYWTARWGREACWLIHSPGDLVFQFGCASGPSSQQVLLGLSIRLSPRVLCFSLWVELP